MTPNKENLENLGRQEKMEGIVSPYLYLLIYPLIIFDKTNINLLLGGKKNLINI
jgi:hypothetical protein